MESVHSKIFTRSFCGFSDSRKNHASSGSIPRVLSYLSVLGGYETKAALIRLRSGEMINRVRSDLTLGPLDMEAIASELRISHPWIAAIAFGPDDDWPDCPGVSPHAAAPQARRVELLWCDDSPGDGRSVKHTAYA
ncbi:hypothetical protein Pph01_20840 [Planotetraspora phitsanulokensis]|uniref:Uncharacterized protein n=1 Tax=Planotetraspora phitsanulokensis TaxID=575192 RepID=A0A8J3U4K6_9ACTN|nr:hypothetical protein Pph01_20840 [Planotetraspora phitsanulokensis]